MSKLAHAFRFQRPGHADLVQADADVARYGFINTQIGQGLAGIQIRFAGRDNADLGTWAIPDDLVQLVHARIGQRRVPFVIVHPRFLAQHGVRQADVQTIRWQFEISRQDDLDAVRIEIDRGAGFNQVGDAFHRYPQTGIAAHGPAMHAVIEILLHRGRIQHRNAAGFQDMFALMCGGRRFGCVIVASQHQYAAILRGAGHVGVLEDIAATVDAGAFAVPHAEYAVVLGAREQVDLLRAPYTGSGQVFVHAGVKLDVMCVQIFFCLGGSHIDATKR